MNTRSRGTLYRIIALVAVLALLPIGAAGAQRPEPPPPATPFDAEFDSAAARELTFGPQSIIPPVGDAFEAGGNRLVAMQQDDGGWDWPLYDGNSANASPLNTIAPITMGLMKAAEHVGDPAMSDAMTDAGALLLTKDGNFSPSDGYLAASLDAFFGVTTYSDFVGDNFYDPLAAGTYVRITDPVNYPDGSNDPNNPYNTAEYVERIRTSRASQGIANLAAWDVGMGLVSAAWMGADTAPWVAGVEGEINELDGNEYYDVIGLAGALFGLCVVDDNFDPTAGEHALANSTDALFTILLGYQLGTGGWTWNANYMTENSDETIQETAYSVLALNCRNRDTYLPAILRGANYLFDTQLGTGGWEGYTGGGENNEITGEALWALDAGYPLGTLWVCETGDCGHPEASTNSIQAAIDAAVPGADIFVFPGNYDETASNRTLLKGTPAESGVGYQFGLFFPITKPGISVIGVDTNGIPLTDPDSLDLPYVTTHATNNFGPSNFWVEGADVTIQGIRQGPNATGENKSIEVVGDGFTLRYFDSDLPDGGGAVYFGDWLYDDGADTSTIMSYHILDSNFQDGTQIAIANGTGVSGPVGDRVISNNSFEFDPLILANWPGVSFSGSGTDVPWFTFPVGGAVITGNSFSGSTSYIRSRGTVEEVDFDWASYWNDNTFDTKVMAGPNPPSQPRAYSYLSGSYNMPNTKIIGAFIQPEIGHAAANDIVLVGAGTYPETGQILINKNLSIQGEDPGDKPVIQPVANFTGNTAATAWWLVQPGMTFSLSDVVVDGAGFKVHQGVRNHGATTIDNVDFEDIIDSTSPYVGVAVPTFGGVVPGGMGSDTHSGAGLAASNVTVIDSTFTNIGRIGVLVKGTLSTATITGSTFTGKGNGLWLDYGVEVGAGGAATIGGALASDGNSFSGNTGVAGDASTSAGVLVTDYYGTGTSATILRNTFTANSTGVYVGYNETDASTVEAHFNKFINNTTYGMNSTAPAVDAEQNWWDFWLGPDAPDNTYGTGDPVSTLVDYRPWCSNIECTEFLPPFPIDVTVTSVTPEPSHRGGSTTIVANVVGEYDAYGVPAPVGTVDIGYPGLSPIPACDDLSPDGSGDVSCSYVFPDGSSFALTAGFTPTDSTEYDTGSATYVHKVWAPATDFEDDDISDFAKFDPATGMLDWFGSDSGTWATSVWMGAGPYQYVPRSDFDGDGYTDPAKFDPATNSLWYIESSTASWVGVYMGPGTYEYVAGSDFDGDGKTDPAHFTPGTNVVWYQSSRLGSWVGEYTGPGTYTLVVGSDFDGDGRTDFAQFGTALNAIWWENSSTGIWDGFYMGAGTFDMVEGSDFDGDFISDKAKFDSASNVLWWYGSVAPGWTGVWLGAQPMSYVSAADFDGDNTTDMAFFDDATDLLWWYSSAGAAWMSQDMGAGTYEIVN